jgi:hypothetical protein
MTESRALRFAADEPDAALDAFARRVADPLHTADGPDADFTARVLAAVEADARTAVDDRQPWWQRRWQVTITPLRGLAAAAVLFVAAMAVAPRDGVAPGGAAAAAPSGVQLVRFELAAPDAQRVVLVGSFNDWTPGATPLRSVVGDDGEARWMITVPLTHGRHEYAFVLDDGTWVADPRAGERRDEFETPTSVLLVESGGTRGITLPETVSASRLRSL